MRRLRRFYISLLTLVLVIITFGTVSFAWVSLATINNLDGIGLTATSGEDLQISIDGLNYYSELPSIFMYQLFNDVMLYDVTTSDNKNFSFGGLRTKTDPVIPNEHYLSFDLWFRSTTQEHGIYLFNNTSDETDYNNPGSGTFVISEGVLWMADESFVNGPLEEDIVHMGSIDRYYAKDSIRIGISELLDDTNPLESRNPNDLITFIYDPQERPDRGFGVTYGAYSYFFRTTLHYLYLPEVFPETSYRLTEMDPHNPYQALDNESLITTLQPTNEVDDVGRAIYQAKVRINVWAEGWDADAMSAVKHDIVKIQLQFKVANQAQDMA